MHLVLSLHLFGSALNFQLSLLLDTKRKNWPLRGRRGGRVCFLKEKTAGLDEEGREGKARARADPERGPALWGRGRGAPGPRPFSAEALTAG